jgi:ADP-ribose pyrophosphatase YjhB (NUDIX family)
MDDGPTHYALQHVEGSDWAQYCPRCGNSLEERYIDAEQHYRKICSSCEFIFYINPEVVAAAVPRQEDRIWLVRRNVEPSLGYWTFPGGYVNLHERVPDAAIRETLEETRLDVRLDGLLNIYSYQNSRVVLIVYRATVIGGIAGVTPESREVRSFHLNDIPWSDLAFPSTREALADYLHHERTVQRQS